MTMSPRRRLSSSPFHAGPEVVAEIYEVGARVSHDTFGLGQVVSVQDTRSAQVDFGDGPQYIPMPCTKMTSL